MTNRLTVVTGASSQIGFFLIPRLIAKGENVLAISRQPLPAWLHQYKDLSSLRWCNLQQVHKQSFPASINLISAGPLALASKLVTELLPEKVIVLSSASVNFKQDSAHIPERNLISKIVLAEENLSKWAQQQHKSLNILRPTLIYGCGRDKSLSRAAALIQRWGFMPVAAKAKGLRQPVHAEDLAGLIINLLESESSGQMTWQLAGGSQLTYAEMIQAVFTALDKPARILKLPEGLLKLASYMLPGINPQMILRQNQDLCVDDSPARDQLGWSPRPFILEARHLTTQ